VKCSETYLRDMGVSERDTTQAPNIRTTPGICGLEWVFGVLIQSIPWFRYSENSRTMECNIKIDCSIGNSSPVWFPARILVCQITFASENKSE